MLQLTKSPKVPTIRIEIQRQCARKEESYGKNLI